MGTVYKAEDVNLSRTVAIKRINPGQQERESFIHRFRSEAQALARIDSSYIVGVYALRDTDIGLLIVMEYVEGGTLKDPLDRQGALAPTQAIPILEQTLKAFADAHSAGVIHRDIKPENVMLTQDGTVKVTDFGIAKLRQPDSGETVTQGGQGGTLKYMSPEQISSIDDVDARSDVYSLGMTAYEILAGDLPFTETDTDFDIMRKVVEGKIPPPDELNPDIPSGLAQWILGAIQKEQDDRYQSAEEMKEALHEANQQTGEKTVTQPDWEVGGADADVDQTQTSVPPSEDRTQTVVPGSDEEEAVPETGGQTVMDPDMGGATQPSVPEPPEDEEAPSPDEPSSEAEPAAEAEDEEATNWALVGGGAVAVLLLLVGGYVALTQLGGSSAGATATLSLTTAPEGALVLVNGDTAGTTPVTGYALDAGPVMLKVRKDGHAPLDTTLRAEAGDRVQLQNVTLADASAGASASDATLAENTNDDPVDEPASDPSATPTEPETTNPESPSEPSSSSQGNSETETDPAAQDDQAPTGGDASASAEAASEPGATGLVEVMPGSPSAVTVLVDGQAQPDGQAVSVTEGTHTVACRHQRHGAVETTVTVAAGRTETLNCYFEQDLTVNTLGPWGRIWLNRSDTGQQTPSTLSLSPGTHRIEVRRKTLDGFTVKGGAVRTQRGGESQVNEFSGRSYQIQVEPGFTEVKHAISFETTGG
jgi:serine/threonine protein kinase